MSIEATTPPTTPSPAPSRRQRPYILIALTTFGVLILAVGAYGFWQKYTSPPEPQAVDLSGLDQEIVDAVEAARNAVKAQPRSAGAWGNLGAVLRAHEFDAEADFCFAEAEKLDPKDVRWPYMIALGLLARDREAALPKLRRAVELCGDRAAPRLQLAEVLLDRGEKDEAEALFSGVLEMAPDDARAHLGLGQIAVGGDDVDGALEHLRRAAAGAPRAKAVHAALAQAYHRSGDEKAAEEERRILRQLPDSWAWPDPAREFVTQFWTGQRARMAAINSFDSQGLHEEAVVAAKQTVMKYPDSPLARLVLGEMLNRSKNFTAAEPFLRDAVRMDPKRAKAHFELGNSLAAQGKYQEGAESYRKTIEFQPDFVLAHNNLAACLVELKDDAGAIREFQAALRYRPGFVDALLGLGTALGRQGRHKEALEQLEEAARVAPSDPRTKQLLEEARKRATKPAKP